MLGTLPVATDEIGHTRAVMVFYCPARIGGELISARLLIKQLENHGRLIESLSFYNITPHKKREKSPVPNVKGFPGVYSDDTLSLCKIKDIVHNTQDYDKKLAGIETETSFHIENMDNLYLSDLDRHGVEHFQIGTLTHNAFVAHLDKITALYPKEPTTVIRKGDGTLARQYGEFEYEQIRGGFERSKNRVLVEEVDPNSLQRLALYIMSSDSYGDHPSGPYATFVGLEANKGLYDWLFREALEGFAKKNRHLVRWRQD